MQMVCHKWNDECCLRFLKNCYDALPKNGKVIIVDIIFPEEPFTANNIDMKTAVYFDVGMFINFRDGKERTEKEFEALAKASGFQGFKVVGRSSAYEFHVIEFLKQN